MERGMKTLVVALLLIALGQAPFAGLALAEEKTCDCTIAATLDDEGNVTSATATTADGTAYTVTMDENGKKMAKELDGKKATVTGDFQVKDDAKTVTVKSSKAKAE